MADPIEISLPSQSIKKIAGESCLKKVALGLVSGIGVGALAGLFSGRAGGITGAAMGGGLGTAVAGRACREENARLENLLSRSLPELPEMEVRQIKGDCAKLRSDDRRVNVSACSEALQGLKTGDKVIVTIE